MGESTENGSPEKGRVLFASCPQTLNVRQDAREVCGRVDLSDGQRCGDALWKISQCGVTQTSESADHRRDEISSGDEDRRLLTTQYLYLHKLPPPRAAPLANRKIRAWRLALGLCLGLGWVAANDKFSESAAVMKGSQAFAFSLSFSSLLFFFFFAY